MNSKIVNLTKAVTSLFFLWSLLLVAPVSAQNYGNNDSSSYVTVYKDCDFRGAARNLPIGDYPDMRSIQMNNDSMSSFRVPQGLQLTLYQDDRFGGFSAIFEQDVRCLDKGWNDQASSLKVNWSDSTNRGDRRSDRGDRNFRGIDDDGFYTQRNVDGNNVSRVEFANNVLEKSGPQQWQMTNNNGQSTALSEQSKNANTLYLQGIGSGERLRIDFFANDVTVMANNGQSASYALNRALRANENFRGDGRREGRPGVIDRPAGRSDPVEDLRETGKVRGNCFDYKAYSNGGEAGVRFHTGDNAFVRFSKKPVSGRICHRGSILMELNKTVPATDVTVEIQGVRYRFASNAAHDSLLNNWYRKGITLNVQP